MNAAATRIGLISDTHNLLRPQALEALRGSDRIIHAGDICSPEVLAALVEIAPLTVVRGNNDRGEWASAMPDVEVVEVSGVRICVIHDVKQLKAVPHGVRVVVSGHSHKPGVIEREGVLYVNPGSAGPRRFKLPVSVGELTIHRGRVAARLIDVQPVER